MTPKQLIALGATHIHWNPAYNGGFHEYFFPIQGDGRGIGDVRLGVRFGEHPKHPVRVLLISSNIMPLSGIKTVDDLLVMYRLVTGREWRGAS